MLKNIKLILLTIILIISTLMIPCKANAVEIGTTEIILTLDKQQVNVGDIITVSLKSQSEVNIFGIQFQMKYDPTVLNLQNNGMQLQGKYTYFGGATVDTSNGILIYPLINNTTDTSNTNEIAKVSFMALKKGTSVINLSSIKAVDDKSNVVSSNNSYKLPLVIAETIPSSDGSGGEISTPVFVNRIFGANRIETSIAIAKEQYTATKPDAVVLATANDFADALVGSGLAYKYNAPLLLVNKTVSNSKSVLEYITTTLSKNKNIYVLGGTAAVSSEISYYLTVKGYNIIRLGGKDRYETNQKIVDYLSITKGTSMVIATGNDFADALSISSIADIKGFPVLLNGKENLSANVRSYITNLQPATVYVVGGTGVLSTNIETQIKKLNRNVQIVRLGGKDRYETSMMIVEHFNLSSTTITVATGKVFPDALSGSVLAARKNAAVLLVGNKDVSKQRELISKEKITEIIVFGGEGAISKDIAAALK